MVWRLRCVVLLSLLEAGAGIAAQEPAPPTWDDAVHRFDNGFELLIEPVKGSKHMGLFFFVKSGWDVDPPDRTGMAHFIEHMVMTAGTPGRQGGWQYDEWVRKRRHGANAMTRAGWTLYFSIGTREDCSSDARWFQEILQGKGVFTPAQLERERERMRGEVRNMTLYRPGGILQWRARGLLLQGAAARKGIGKIADIDAMKLEELRRQASLTHHAGNVLCIAAGRVHEERDLPFYKELFGGLTPRKTPTPVAWKAENEEPAVTQHPNVGAVFASLAFAAPQTPSADYPAFLHAATWLMQRAMVEHEIRGKQLEGMFFPAQYSYLEAPELFLLNLRGIEGQSQATVRKDLEDWLARKRSARIGWAHLRTTQSSLRLFYPPFPLERQDLGFFAGAPRNLYRLGLSRGVCILGKTPRDLPARLSKVEAKDLSASLARWFGSGRERFLALLPRTDAKGKK